MYFIVIYTYEEHRNVYPEIPLVGFRNGKSLKQFLVRAKLPTVKCKGSSGICNAKPCEVCQYIEPTKTFSNKDKSVTYSIEGNDLNCSSKMVVYLVQCKSCNKQYIGSASTKFRLRFNNDKCCHRKYISNQEVPQQSFHPHFNCENHNGMEDWQFTLIDEASNVDSLRRKESFWQYKLDCFVPNGLNERNVTLY